MGASGVRALGCIVRRSGWVLPTLVLCVACEQQTITVYPTIYPMEPGGRAWTEPRMFRVLPERQDVIQQWLLTIEPLGTCDLPSGCQKRCSVFDVRDWYCDHEYPDGPNVRARHYLMWRGTFTLVEEMADGSSSFYEYRSWPYYAVSRAVRLLSRR